MVGFVKSEASFSDLLLLDLDGTIADIADRPEDAAIDPAVKPALAVLAGGAPPGRVIVTGRSLADADRLLHPVQLAMLASHGAEVRVPGLAMPLACATLEPVRGVIETLAAGFAGVRVEWKPFGAAVHFRAVPELADGIGAALGAFARAHPAYRVQAGRMVFEVVPADVSKARAVRWLLQRPGFAGRRVTYVGDDGADEAAMAVVEAGGGSTLRVAGEHFSRAHAHFDGPAAVRAWLAGLALGCGGGPPGSTASGL